MKLTPSNRLGVAVKAGVITLILLAGGEGLHAEERGESQTSLAAGSNRWNGFKDDRAADAGTAVDSMAAGLPVASPVTTPVPPKVNVASAGGIIVLTDNLADGTRVLTTIDTSRKWMAVYHIKTSSGEIHLRSSRPMEADLSFLFNATSPLPSEIDPDHWAKSMVSGSRPDSSSPSVASQRISAALGTKMVESDGRSN